MRIWAALVSVQLALYLVQENLELRLLGLPGAGLHVLTVHHGLPLAVHGAVAFGATVIAVLVADGWGERLARASGVARLYVRLAAPLHAGRALARRPRPSVASPAACSV